MKFNSLEIIFPIPTKSYLENIFKAVTSIPEKPIYVLNICVGWRSKWWIWTSYISLSLASFTCPPNSLIFAACPPNNYLQCSFSWGFHRKCLSIPFTSFLTYYLSSALFSLLSKISVSSTDISSQMSHRQHKFSLAQLLHGPFFW